MKRTIGITGSKSFIGTHLFNTLSLVPEKYTVIAIHQMAWKHPDELFDLINACDVIFHLAGVNRHADQEFVYTENVRMAEELIQVLQKVTHPIQVIFSSSLQEQAGSVYGNAKKKARQLFEQWAAVSGNSFIGCIIPNVFGPFGKPHYNSFVATFCHQLNHNETPTIQVDASVPLLYVGDLVAAFQQLLENTEGNTYFEIPPTSNKKVSEILQQLQHYSTEYLEKGIIPQLETKFDIQLFNTFRSYLPYETVFPKHYIEHSDNRGAFVELVRLGMGGQVSFSTTLPGITRGNHFHTRKIERFSVIKGKAKMELKKYGTEEVHTFYLDGAQPAYIDIPIWYYHNITNIGEDVLYTIFWISEQFNPEDADTYFEK